RPAFEAISLHGGVLEDDGEASRVHGVLPVGELEVEVGLCGIAGVAELADHLAAGYGVSDLYPHTSLLHVGVLGKFASRVADDHVVADHRLGAFHQQLVLGLDGSLLEILGALAGPAQAVVGFGAVGRHLHDGAVGHGEDIPAEVVVIVEPAAVPLVGVPVRTECDEVEGELLVGGPAVVAVESRGGGHVPGAGEREDVLVGRAAVLDLEVAPGFEGLAGGVLRMSNESQPIGGQPQQEERFAEDDESRPRSERTAAGDVEAGQIPAGLEVEVIELEDSLPFHGGEALGALVEIRRGDDDGLQDLAAGDRLDLQGIDSDRPSVLLDDRHVLEDDGIEAAGRIDLVGIDDVCWMDADFKGCPREGKQYEQQGEDTPHDGFLFPPGEEGWAGLFGWYYEAGGERVTTPPPSAPETPTASPE